MKAPAGPGAGEPQFCTALNFGQFLLGLHGGGVELRVTVVFAQQNFSGVDADVRI